MDNLLGNPVSTIAFLAAAIIFAYLYFFKPKLKDRDTEYHQAGDGLIKILQETVTVLEENMNKNKSDFEDRMSKKDIELKEFQERLQIIEEEHELLKNIFQGRDKDSVKEREANFETNGIVKNMNDMLVKTHAKTLAIEKKVYGN